MTFEFDFILVGLMQIFWILCTGMYGIWLYRYRRGGYERTSGNRGGGTIRNSPHNSILILSGREGVA